MAANNRNGNSKRHTSNSDTRADKKSLALVAGQYWKLSYLQKEIELVDYKIAVEEREFTIRQKDQRIKHLEASLIEQKKGALKQVKRNKIDELNQYRNEIAKALSIEDLGKYIIDTDTFELIHEDNLQGKA
jgi:hypothetical protein